MPESTPADTAPLSPDSSAPAAVDSFKLWEQLLHELDQETARALEPDARGFADFELNFESSLARQLGPFIDALPAMPLTAENVRNSVPAQAKGAYYLMLNREVIYIGKSDAKLGLQHRLLRHHKTLKRRKNIDWTQMEFKAVKVASFAALDTESLLLDLYKRKARALGKPKTEHRPEWNFSGFGSNDTGKERDTQRVSLFDQKYPIDLDAEIEFEGPLPPEEDLSLEKYLVWLAKQLQLTVRRQKDKVPAAQCLKRTHVKLAPLINDKSIRGLILAVSKVLPSMWVLTVLRGKIVLYQNDKRPYKSPIWQLKAGKAPPMPDYFLRDVGKAEPEAGELDEEADASKA